MEILGQTALFTNGRVSQQEIPDSLYSYELRSGEGVNFATIQPAVKNNFAGTIILKAPLNFDGQQYIALDSDSRPTFTGEKLTVMEFLDMEFDQAQDEVQQIGGIQL